MYFNVTETLASLSTASDSFTTGIDVQNFDNAAMQAVWTGLDAADATLQIQGSIDGTNWDNLTSSATTLISAADNQLYNITDLGYNKIRLDYEEGANTTGSVSVVVTRKSRR